MVHLEMRIGSVLKQQNGDFNEIVPHGQMERRGVHALVVLLVHLQPRPLFRCSLRRRRFSFFLFSQRFQKYLNEFDVSRVHGRVQSSVPVVAGLVDVDRWPLEEVKTCGQWSSVVGKLER